MWPHPTIAARHLTLWERLEGLYNDFNDWLYMLDGRAVTLAAVMSFTVVMLLIALTASDHPDPEDFE